MGRKKEKLRKRLDSLPTDFTWNELVTILSFYGFDVINGKGSKRKFYNKELDRVVICHEPHPKSIVKEYVLKEIKILLDEISK